jgi:hypothetical protein
MVLAAAVRGVEEPLARQAHYRGGGRETSPASGAI